MPTMWTIPGTVDFPVTLYIEEGDGETRTFDPQGSHPITNFEIIRLLKFKIWLRKIGEL